MRAASQAPPSEIRQPARLRSLAKPVDAATSLLFAFSIVLLLATYSNGPHAGPLSWGALWRVPTPADFPTSLGPLAVLQALIVVLWPCAHVLARPHRPWTWGLPRITLPLALLTLVALLSPDLDLAKRSTLETLALLVLTWFIYLYVVNR